MQALTSTFSSNNAWYRQIAAGWARRMITGDVPEAWAQNTDAEIQFAIQQLNLRRGDRLLDLGCGWGRHSLSLGTYGVRVTGVDISHELLTMAQYNARRRNVSVDLIEADIANLPLHGPFDAIAQFCGNFLTWFSNRETTLETLLGVVNVLRPGGRLLVGTDDWMPELPARRQEWDEWRGGAAIYRHRYDGQQRIKHSQTIVFGPQHERHEYRRQTWWPSAGDMETLFDQVGLVVRNRTNAYGKTIFSPHQHGLIYVLERRA